MMIQLLPSATDADGGRTNPDGELVITDTMAAIGAEQRPGTPERPWVFTNMIASADGGTAVDGLSGALGGDGDRQVFSALRSQADVILVGAATARAEQYRSPRANSEAVDQRLERGQQPRPRIAVLSNSLDLDPDLPFFDDDTSNQPIVVTSERSRRQRGSALDGRAKVMAIGDDQVDLARTVTRLAEMGLPRVLCEGGPSINGQMASLGLVDEWNLTIAPLLAAGESKRAAVGPLPEGPPPEMELARVWLNNHYLFCRWVKASEWVRP